MHARSALFAPFDRRAVIDSANGGSLKRAIRDSAFLGKPRNQPSTLARKSAAFLPSQLHFSAAGNVTPMGARKGDDAASVQCYITDDKKRKISVTDFRPSLRRLAHDQDRLLIYLLFIQSNCYSSQSLHSVLFKRYSSPFFSFPLLATNFSFTRSFILLGLISFWKTGGNFSRHA